MQKLHGLRSRFISLSVDKSSTHPTARDSAHIKSALFEDVTSTPSNSADEEQPVSNVVIKHSSAFNSERATGMNKLQQLQFVDTLKHMIVNEASMVYPTLAEFRVVTSRKFRICPASPNTFCNATVHVATLVTGAGSTVVQQGRECEYLADAVENLWEKMLEKAGGVVEDPEADDKDYVEIERADSGDTLLASET